MALGFTRSAPTPSANAPASRNSAAVASDMLLVGQPHLPHAALADKLEKMIGTDDGAGVRLTRAECEQTSQEGSPLTSVLQQGLDLGPKLGVAGAGLLDELRAMLRRLRHGRLIEILDLLPVLSLHGGIGLLACPWSGVHASARPSPGPNRESLCSDAHRAPPDR